MTATAVIFARAPVAGRTKTRLAAGIGAEAALEVYLELVGRTVAAVAAARTPDRVEVHFAPHEGRDAVAAMIGRDDWVYRPQPEGDLGARMQAVFDPLAKAPGKTVLVGTDCPELHGLIDAAFGLLDEHPLVLGPSTDGGYTLIGLDRPAPQLFSDMTWSTAGVLSDTLDRARWMQWTVGLLPTRSDIDTAEDLTAWREGPSG